MTRSVSGDVPAELVDHPQYEVLRELGRGGMGAVYLARHRLSGRHEVLKVMTRESLDREGSKERFLREIQAAARLDHANVVRMYSALEAGKLLVLVMEYVEGQELAELVKASGRLPIVLACYYVQQAALGLQHAHEKGMVHRDIKPQNLILSRPGKRHVVKVLDFGLAKATRESGFSRELTVEGKLLGTPDYIAPEQAMDAARADIRADIYSLGCTLYFLFTGKPPFEAKSFFELLLAHQSQEARPLHRIRPDVPADLATVVRKMMAKDPRQRFQTPAEVIQALAPFVKTAAKTSAGKVAQATPAEVTQTRPTAPAPAKEAPVRWDTLVESSKTPPAGRAINARPKRRRGVRRRELMLVGLAGGLIVVVLMGVLLELWTAGAFHGRPRGEALGNAGEPPVEGEEAEVAFALADPAPRLGVRFHEEMDDIIREPTMRFGLVMLKEADPKDPSKVKRLSYDIRGRSNNACLRIDGTDHLFGENAPGFPEPRGRWESMKQPLEQNRPWPREGAKSIWVYDDVKLFVTQTVEVVPGEPSRLLDSCRVRYRIENRDSKPHRVGLRFLLDTFIGAIDGAPFLIPGSRSLCDTKHTFDAPAEVPDFIQALENEDLIKPGTVAQVQFRLGAGIESPDRVTLGAWPDTRLATSHPNLRSRLRQQNTGWDVPELPMKTMLPPDSAVVMYWDERSLAAGATREVGFSYGLGELLGGEGHGKLALTIGGSFAPGGEFTVIAYVQGPQPGQKLTLAVPYGFEILGGGAEQAVPPLPPDAASRNSPVTWKVRAARRARTYTLNVQSSTGETQHVSVTIRGKGVFD
jgi:serine/threonine protein kinase